MTRAASRRRLAPAILGALALAAPALGFGTTAGAQGTITAPTKPPSASFGAEFGDTGSYLLRWTASSDDVGVTAYEISREGTVVATVAAEARRVHYTWRVAADLPSTGNYEIRAIDTAGNRSAPRGVVQTENDFRSGDGTLTVFAANPSTLRGNWTIGDNERRAAFIYRNGEPERGFPAEGAQVFFDPLFKPGYYKYVLYSVTSAGNIRFSAYAVASLGSNGGAPSAPGSPTLTAIGSDGFEISWEPASDDGGIAYYDVWTYFGTERVTPETRSIKIGGVGAGRHAARVTAVDGFGARTDGPLMSVMVGGPDSQPPSAPTGVRLAFAGPFSVLFDPATDNNVVDGYLMHVDGRYTAYQRNEPGSGGRFFPDTPNFNLSAVLALPDGLHAVDLRSQDSFGNFSAPTRLWLRKDGSTLIEVPAPS